MNEQKTIKTTSRKLENYLYLMGVSPLRMFKEWDGMTVWEYEDTAEFRLIVDNFQDLHIQLKAMREGVERE